MNQLSQDTFVLVPQRRGFLTGVADILDRSPLTSRYTTSKTEQEADARAIESDWRAIGNDIKTAYVWGEKQLSS